MAQNITLLGANYTDVPAVDLPKTGGGTARFVDLNEVNYAGSPSVGGNANTTNAILYGTVDGTSTSTAFTATVSGLTALAHGTTVMLKNGVVTSASGFTINVNGLGAKPVYNNMAAAGAETTIFNINYTMMFIYDSTRVAGGCWLCYRGYNSDTNTIGHQLRTNSRTKPASDKGYRYRLWFTSADGTKFVPANKSSSTNATASRTPNTTPIDPFGEIIYYSTNGTTNANANLTATTQWQQYPFSLGYSFNTTGSALTLTFPAPVYIKCTPQSNGSATLDGYVQALPSTEDGKIYIYLGTAYSATNVELVMQHPVYYYKDSAIRLWTNAPSSGGGGADPATASPLMDGTASVGSSTKYAREDHVHPTDTSKQDTLVSGTNIKTINGNSILGSGDLAVGGSIQCHIGETVTAADYGTYWSLQLNYPSLIDETTLPLSILFEGIYWINAFYYTAGEFVISYDFGSNILEDGGTYTVDIYYINV